LAESRMYHVKVDNVLHKLPIARQERNFTNLFASTNLNARYLRGGYDM